MKKLSLFLLLALAVGAGATYTVTYDGNGNGAGTVPTDGNTYLQGATVTVLGNTGGLVKMGYNWTSWNTAANGSGTSYAPAATFAMGTANVTLYAQWTAKSYALTVLHGTGSGTYDSAYAAAIGVTAPGSDSEFTTWSIVSGSGAFNTGYTTFAPYSAATIRANMRILPPPTVAAKSFQTWINLSPNIGGNYDGTPCQRIAQGMCIHKGNIIIAGGHSYAGNDSSVWRTTNGQVWYKMASAAARFSPRIINNNLLSVRDTLWIFGGGYYPGSAQNDVWYSVDTGTNWTLGLAHADWSGRLNHTTNYDSITGRFIITGGVGSAGGFKSDVWYTTNPRGTWTCATTYAAFDSLQSHVSQVLNSTIYVMGGYKQPGSMTNDIYMSACSDLATWSKISVVGNQWSARCCQGTCTIGNSIYMIAGYEGASVAVNDVWRSDDSCRTWFQEIVHAPWPLRDSPTAVAWNGKIYLFGGYKWDNTTRLNDCWVTLPLKPILTTAPLSGYAMSKIVTLKTTHNVQDFISCINLRNFPSDFWQNTKLDGSDILVTDAANTPLDRELQGYDSATHKGLLWVRSNIYDDSTKLKIHYKNASASNSNATTVWTTNNNFEAMYHFTEPTGTYASSANTHNGTVSGTVNRNLDSLLSPCVSFTGAGSGIINIGNITSLNNPRIVRFSLQTVMRSNNTTNSFAKTNEAGFYWEFESDYHWFTAPGTFKVKKGSFPLNVPTKYDLIYDGRWYGTDSTRYHKLLYNRPAL
jgi:uncharacterized repeat protein (TIGR02543 family)